MEIRETIRRLHVQFADSRGMQATYCPCEVARKITPDNWRTLMHLVREVADDLVKEGSPVVMQKGHTIPESATKAVGPICLRRKC